MIPSKAGNIGWATDALIARKELLDSGADSISISHEIETYLTLTGVRTSFSQIEVTVGGAYLIGAQGYDNIIPEADAGYSLRLINAYFTDGIVSIRRDSDNFVKKFTEPELLDGTLDGWMGGANGYVSQLMNQYEVDVNQIYQQKAYQFQVALQPLIYDSVTGLQKVNGEPAIIFSGSQVLRIDNYYPETQLSGYFVTAVDNVDPPSDGYIWDNLTSDGKALINDNVFSGRITFVNDSPLGVQRVRADTVDTNLHLYSIFYKASVAGIDGELRIYKNGDLEESQQSTAIGDSTKDFTMYIGASSDTGTTGAFSGAISEFIFYNKYDLENRLEITTNIETHYGLL